MRSTVVGMGAEEEAVDVRGVGVGEIRLRQLNLDVDQGPGVMGELEGELVGARLDLARELVPGHVEHERGERQGEEVGGDRRRVARSVPVRRVIASVSSRANTSPSGATIAT